MPTQTPVKPGYLSYPEYLAWKEENAYRVRRAWTNVALFSSLLAVALEALFHPCAQILFDPLPDVITGIAYAWVIFFLWFNRATLDASRKEKPVWNPLVQWLGIKRATGLALAGTSLAFLVAGMACWMFLPFIVGAPIVVMTIIGTLTLVPALDLVVLILQFRALRRGWREREGTFLNPGLALGTGLLWVAALFFLVVRPTLIGNWLGQALSTSGSEQQEAFRGLRLVRGEQAMLDLTYKRNPPYWVTFGYKSRDQGYWPWSGYSWDSWKTDAARRDYFLLTGTPYESVPRPDSFTHTRGGMFGLQDEVAVEEQGGYVVGRPVPDVRLQSSEMQFATNARTETARGTWTLTFRNDNNEAQEARADILLPPGATCDQVSLWVNGVEKPAAFGAPQKVRAAYRKVAVVQRRDPLLVTLPAPGHLLAQCFPVPAHGEMKIKLGFTQPLTWQAAPGQAPRLLLAAPALGPVNFEVPARLPHNVTLSPSVENVTLAINGANIFKAQSFAIATERAAPRVGDTLAPGIVRTEDPLAMATRPLDVWLLVDASEGMTRVMTPTVRQSLKDALAQLPAGSQVHFGDTVTADTTDAAGGFRIGDLPSRFAYVGGTDAAPALKTALFHARDADDPQRTPVVVFLHAATPANVSDLYEVRRELQQSLAKNGPTLVSVQMAPRAQDTIAMDLAGFPNVYLTRALPGDPSGIANAVRFAVQAAQANHSPVRSPEAVADLPLGGRFPAVNGVTFRSRIAPETVPADLPHLYQASLTTGLWLRSNITPDAGKAFDLRVAAGQPAAMARLVTPVSSAVVLETKEQYEENDLDEKDGKKGFKDAKKAPGPEIQSTNAPEPASGLLALTGLAIVPWLRRRRAARRSGNP